MKPSRILIVLAVFACGVALGQILRAGRGGWSLVFRQSRFSHGLDDNATVHNNVPGQVGGVNKGKRSRHN